LISLDLYHFPKNTEKIHATSMLPSRRKKTGFRINRRRVDRDLFGLPNDVTMN